MTKKLSLRLFAGNQAKQHLNTHGLSASDVKFMLAASGGPKWMVLFGLDQYLTKDFFSEKHTFSIVGSSAGAMRACCYTQRDAAAAIQRFADAYTNTRYDSKPSAKDISDSARVLLDQLFADNGIEEILHNPQRHAHIITTRCHGMSAHEHKILQSLGMLQGYLLNKVSRRWLSKRFERVIFHTGPQLNLDDTYQLPTMHVSLNKINLYQAALASGSIPMVMEGVRQIPDAPSGTYRDGGIIDYHFDLGLGEGLCLYPHFNSSPRAAWFDKFGSRPLNHNHLSNTLILAPSADFIAKLPYGKIPDRKDFADMDDPEREKVWRHCQNESHRLAEEFHELIEKQNWQSIEDLNSLG